MNITMFRGSHKATHELVGLLVTAVLLMATSGTAADVFMLDVVAPPNPARTKSAPIVEVEIKDDKGKKIKSKVLMDSGAVLTQIIDTDKQKELKLDVSKAKKFFIRSLTGRTPAFDNVPLPADRSPGFKGTTPPGQKAKQPSFPGTVNVAPTPTLDGIKIFDGIIGSEYLKNFGSYGMVTGRDAKGKPKKFWKLITKSQYETPAKAAAAEKKVQDIAFPRAKPKGGGKKGRPAGTKTAPIKPTPKKPKKPGELNYYDGGFDLDALVSNPINSTSVSVPLTIQTGLSSTLISESVAMDLGLNPIHGTKMDVAFPIGDGILELDFFDLLVDVLFDGVSLVSLAVGVLPDPLNPFGDSFLGADFMDSFAYWGIDTIDSEFYAAQTLEFVPEPTTAQILILGLVLLLAAVVRRRLAGRKIAGVALLHRRRARFST